MTQDMDACKHLRIQSWFTAEGEPVPLWSCAACQVKFEPLVLNAAPAGDLDMLKALIRRECDDADAILRAISLDPETYRTEGGNLNLPKIRNALAESAAAPAGEPLRDALDLAEARLEQMKADRAQALRWRAALDKIAERTGSDDPCRHLVQLARDALNPER